jgi:hypothetical protein
MSRALNERPSYYRPLKLDAQGGMESGDPTCDWLIYRLRNMGAYCDRDGRPLGEGNLPKEQRRSGVPFALRPCPYSGARATVQPERPMNISAMRRVRSTLPEAFGAFLQLREQFFSGLAGRPFSFIDLWHLGQLAEALPRFVAWRKIDAVPDGKLPPYIADLTKLAAGVSHVMLYLAVREAFSGGRASLETMTLETLANEAERMLVGEKQVCPAPPALIKEALCAFVTGKVHLETKRSPIGALVKDFMTLLDFTLAYSDQKIFLWLLAGSHKIIICDLSSMFEEDGLLSRRPALDGIWAVILQRVVPANRFYLLQKLAGILVSQRSSQSPRLIESFERAGACLGGDHGSDPVHLRAIRHRWPSMDEVTARRAASATTRCLQFEAAVLEILSTLEATLRVPLGQPSAQRACPLALFDLVIGPSSTADLEGGLGLS